MRQLAWLVLAWFAIAAAVIFELPRTLLLGWFTFIWDTLPRATVNGPAIMSGTVIIALFLITLHSFATLMCRAASTPERPRRWRWKWTLSATVLLVVLFASGFATIALARHIGWLASTPQSIYGPTYGPPARMLDR